MIGLNTVTLAGYIGQNPWESQNKTDKYVVKFTLGIPKPCKGSDGGYKTVWEKANCTAFGKSGEAVMAAARTKAPIVITGRIITSSYKDRAGNFVNTTSVHVAYVQQPCKGWIKNIEQEAKKTQRTTPVEEQPPDFWEDDIPF